MPRRTSATELESRWSELLLERNRRGTRTVLGLALVLYPLFGVLDALVAPPGSLMVLYGTRLFAVAITVAMFWIVERRWFARRADLLSAAYMLLLSCGISLMTVNMGGLVSPYYAGLSLTIVASGLLFMWPYRLVVATHSFIVLSFILPNLLAHGPHGGFNAISNLFFLISTAIIAGTGQILSYRMQREQMESQLEVEWTKARLEGAHTRLQQLDRFRSEFFANITHEFKTPLTMILAPLELMLQGEMGRLTDPQRASLESMLRSGVKLLRLIGNLLDLSKLDESRLRLRIAEHDLVAYCQDLVAQIRPLAERKGIALTFSSNVEICRVQCDLPQLERVFVNLLSNASKFTPDGGKIALSLKDDGERVHIAVADTGAGFAPEMASRIFERFVQIDAHDGRRLGGTGIGLAISRELVLLHGGTIRAESQVGAGATFTVELCKGDAHFDPQRTDRSDEAEQDCRQAGDFVADFQLDMSGAFRFLDIDEATDQRVVVRDQDEDERKQSVLVVEDTPDVIRVIHLALRSHFRLLAALGGEKGFELAVAHRPSLIIADLMMPDIDGTALTRRLRADPRTKHIPIVMLTARGDSDDRVAGMDVGVNAYLTKPFSARELVSTVRGLVRIQESNADLVLTHSMDSLQSIAGGLAHEINNPLNSLQNSLSLLQSDVDMLIAATPSNDWKASVAVRTMRMFRVAHMGLQRIGGTVALLQRYSREGYTRTLQPFDVFEAARDTASMLQAGMSQPVIVLEFQGRGLIECVPEEVNQVLTNLIQNALDALPSDGSGRVRVRGTSQGDHVVLSVSDNGCGIPAELQARIFTPFFTTKEVGRGMGLGLAIVQRVVASLHGTVAVRSDTGSGTEFVLRIPQAGSATETAGPLEAQPPGAARRPLSGAVVH